MKISCLLFLQEERQRKEDEEAKKRADDEAKKKKVLSNMGAHFGGFLAKVSVTLIVSQRNTKIVGRFFLVNVMLYIASTWVVCVSSIFF